MSSAGGSFTFPSRPRPGGGVGSNHSAHGSDNSVASSVFPGPPNFSRPLPSFGNPNVFPNPPSHYFPSAPRTARATAQGRRRPGAPEESRDDVFPPSPSPPPVDHLAPVPEGGAGAQRVSFPGPSTARPKKGSGVGAARRQEWNAASEALRELDEEDEEMGEEVGQEGEGEVEGEDELDDHTMDLDGAPGAAARAKEQQEMVDQSGESAKKRSRTLTTPHQTRVLNALLAKVSSSPVSPCNPTFSSPDCSFPSS